ncbi:Scr1 family TA system antitoxin-like transcriptional regulator [Nocardia sp. CA-129566]|uniref:Scr1 family TA system antitoxin-like transcriptional regulator n=1 Tax=Nocardia sp. CA-129566 TaxID=3239976 RepID=UPI003D98BA31
MAPKAVGQRRRPSQERAKATREHIRPTRYPPEHRYRIPQWRKILGTGTKRRQQASIKWESEARILRWFEPVLVPGPLQTADYATGTSESTCFTPRALFLSSLWIVDRCFGASRRRGAGIPWSPNARIRLSRSWQSPRRSPC